MFCQDIEETKQRLPVYKAKEEIIEVVRKLKTVIFIGATATGKTTQVPQYLLEAGLVGNKCIVITQPRRVAAVSIAKRVAEEVRTELGGKVGFCVRFENATSPDTQIKYVTDGMLLREAMSDPLLSGYSIVMLDEAHERTLNNDILFGIVKMAQKKREQNNQTALKIIVSSATLDHNQLSRYFDKAPAYHIEGRKYRIEIMNTVVKQEDYVWAALKTIFKVHQNEKEGDILVFCTGQQEIDSMVCDLEKAAVFLPVDCLKMCVCKLYAALPYDVVNLVFKPTPPGYRKVIISTNIAETSVTIPGVKFVVDTGMVKAQSYNSLCGFDILKVQRISKAQANQRSGRAGREFDGVCYRLYTPGEYAAFKDHTVPEVLRCCLSNAILQMIAVGIKNVIKFDFVDKPSDENVLAAIKQLKLLDAVTETDGHLELTEVGQKMIKFPLDPRFSKIIITSKAYKCTDEILTIISLLSADNIFYFSENGSEKFREVREKFETAEGDHIMLLNIYKAFKKLKGNLQTWCQENFIDLRNMKKAVSIRKQLSRVCEKLDIKPCSAQQDTRRIRKCLASGLFMNTVIRDFVPYHGAKRPRKDIALKTLEGKQEVKFHPTSCLYKSQQNCFFYTELVQTTQLYMRYVSALSEHDLREVAPTYFEEKRLPDHTPYIINHS